MNILCRYARLKWVEKFLCTEAAPFGYTSFTGNLKQWKDYHGECLLFCLKSKLLRQSFVRVKYTVPWFNFHPKYRAYITNLDNIEWRREPAKEKKSIIKSFSIEQEFIIKDLVFDPTMFKLIILPQRTEKWITDKLTKHNIKYIIDEKG